MQPSMEPDIPSYAAPAEGKRQPRGKMGQLLIRVAPTPPSCMSPPFGLTVLLQCPSPSLCVAAALSASSAEVQGEGATLLRRNTGPTLLRDPRVCLIRRGPQSPGITQRQFVLWAPLGPCSRASRVPELAHEGFQLEASCRRGMPKGKTKPKPKRPTRISAKAAESKLRTPISGTDGVLKNKGIVRNQI
ncbi:hypothetical protein NDU88_005960 [Pleurodeles waltl]|uniref:Uncharacterized protein n=1 Tax=Pleurodeles waltl TaxID=8319 RepID=A0AAV7TE66_PLEWA|nr:hypothetical protein NDU88_005960 [Pleurodeles waltl]